MRTSNMLMLKVKAKAKVKMPGMLSRSSMLLSLGIVSFALVLLMAGSSAAVTAYTLDGTVGPVAYTGGSVNLDPIPGAEVLSGLGGSIDCLDGTCDILTQDWVVFRVSVLSGNVGEVGLSVFNTFASALNPLGMGYFLEGGPVQDGSGSTATYTGSAATDVPLFSFLANGGGAGITGTTLALFVTYAGGTFPFTSPDFGGVFGDSAVSFMVEPFGGAGAASGQGNFLDTIEVVPEPTTALLLGLGLAMLGVQQRRSQS